MLRSQDDFDFTPRESDLLHRKPNGYSPARKRGRGHIFDYPDSQYNSQSIGEDLSAPGMYAMSLDSPSISQFSQDVVDRLGQMNVRGSQEDLNFMATIDEASNSSCDNFTIPTAPTSKRGKLHLLPPTAKKLSQTRLETEKQIDIRPINSNPFVQATMPTTEAYFHNVHGVMRKMTKLWISAFKERSRYLTEFEELTLLGEGTFSAVYCARHRLDGTLYAVKKVKERMMTENHTKLILRETCALAALVDCPNLVRFHTCWIEEGQLYIQLELCPLGSVEELIKKAPSKGSILNVIQQQNSKPNYSIPDHSQDNIAGTGLGSSLPSLCLTQGSDHSGSGVGTGGMGSASFMMFETSSWSERNRSDSYLSQPPAPSDLVTPRNHHGPVDLQAAFASDGDHDSHHAHDSENRETEPLVEPAVGIPEELAWLLLQEVSKTLSFMHQRGLVHLDLRPANFFMTHSRTIQSQLKAGASGSLFSAVMGGESAHASSSSSASQTVPADSQPPSAPPSQMLSQMSQQSENPSPKLEARRQVECALIRGEYVIRVGDLGHVRRIDEETAVEEGESRYCPRELIDFDRKKIDLRKADIFSLGASVYELCLGRPLGATEAGMEEWHCIRDGLLESTWYDAYSPSLTGLIGRMLHPDPSRRPSADNVLQECRRQQDLETRESSVQSVKHLPETVTKAATKSTEELSAMSPAALVALVQSLQAENARLTKSSK